MLQILRNKAQSIFIQAIVVVIALVFIFWGVGTNMMNSREAAIVVNGEEISFQDYQNTYDRTYENIKNQFGGNIPQELLESFDIKSQVVNQLIQEALLRQGAAEMGIYVSRQEVQETIKNMVQLKENGRCSLARDKALLAANGFTPTTFEETVQLDMLAQKTRLDIADFATTATENEIKDLYRLDNTEVAIQYVALQPQEYSGTVKVDEKELEAWYANVQDNYRTEPQVKLRYLDFSYNEVAEKITIDDDAVEQYYQDNISTFSEEEQRRARHILLKADENSPAEVHERQKKKAEEIVAMARQGHDFAELAEKHSEGPSSGQGGDLGLFSRGQMVKPFEEAAFALEEGGISDVVKTTFGYHIIKVEEIIPPTTKPLAEVKDAIYSELRTQQAKPLAFRVANEAYENIIAAGSLGAYLETNPQVSLKETEFFTRSNPPHDIINDPNFLSTAFSLNEQELSSLIETSQGYAILFAEGVKPPQVPELDTVREQVVADFKDHKAQITAQEKAQALLQKAREAGTLEEAAQAEDLTVKESDYLKKGNSRGTLPRNIIDGAFELSAGSPFPEEPVRGEGDGAFYVYSLADRKIPAGELSEEEERQYRDAIIQRKQQQVFSGWLANQQEDADIRTHTSL